MKISSVRSEKFRSFEDVIVPLNDYTCLVGPNGADVRQFSESKRDRLDPTEREKIERQDRLLQQGYTRRTARTTRASSEWRRESVDFNRAWWIFCVSERTSDWEEEAWRSTQDPAYDHVTEIYQPRKFAQALGLAPAEQLEIERDHSVMRSSVDGSNEVERRFRVQQVLHGQWRQPSAGRWDSAPAGAPFWY